MTSLRAAGLGRFTAREDASVVVEVALVAPIAFAFLSCLTMLSEGMEILGKVNVAASTIGNIVSSQASPLNLSNLNCILGAASPVMAPWSASPLSVTVSEVLVDSTGQNATVQWSEASYNGTALTANQTIVLPSGSSAPAGSYLILTQVRYSFTPVVFTKMNFASFTVSRSLYLPTLNNGAIDLDTSS